MDIRAFTRTASVGPRPTQPLPMISAIRESCHSTKAASRMFGSGSTPARNGGRVRAEDRSILDWVLESAGRLKRDLALSGPRQA